MQVVTFSGCVGNSRGGAFLPGTYTVDFYLNGQYLAAKKFEVLPTPPDRTDRGRRSEHACRT